MKFNDTDYKAVKNKFLSLLARREYSKSELKLKANTLKYPVDIVNAVINDFESKDLQSDIRYCEMVFRAKINKRYGFHYIVSFLKQKGVSAKDIEAVSSNLPIDWDDLANEALKKYCDRNDLLTSKDIAKAINYLRRKGFAADSAMISAKSIIEE